MAIAAMSRTATRLRPFAVILGLVSSTLIAGCADHRVPGEGDADLAAARGDWPAAAILAERIYYDHPSAAAKFKLATAYQNIGRIEKAAALYEDVIFEGDETPTRRVRGWVDGNALSPLSDEAARRLGLMAVQIAKVAGS